MSREHAYVNILDAAAKIQWNVAMILEAKALEAEKARNWTLNHLHASSFSDHESQLGQPLNVHEQMVELIDGLTKLENGLCSNLRAVLSTSGGGSGDSDGFGDMLGGLGGLGGLGFGDEEK
ncbi:restriction endonuclease subunit S [Paenibacillus yonginensis]|uniref:Restriction endonuclease subunit S n=1 Tax=Paenibacillus yonginensis TaxID=1462996 RepID=A0A1B1N2D8_9BACL|nr:restriction endonuclease subunit S [Paenibacillus yonginensis]ANS75590.1 restriction endonuclease subunit S [Paenibacillus yonginensis]